MGGLSVLQQTFGTIFSVSRIHQLVHMSHAVAVSGLTNVWNFTLITSPTSGVIGLGLEGGNITAAAPFMQRLLQDNKLTSSVMSIFFSRPNGTSTFGEEPGGTFTLGGTNQNLYSGEIEYLPVLTPDGPTAWSLSLTRMPINIQNYRSSAQWLLQSLRWMVGLLQRQLETIPKYSSTQRSNLLVSQL
jgi:hypothetical protein